MSPKLFPFAASSTLQFSLLFSINFMTSSDILYIFTVYNQALQDHIIWFLFSIHVRARFFSRLLTMRMCWTIYSGNLVSLVPLQHLFCSSVKSPWLISKSQISPLICGVRISSIGTLWVSSCLGRFLLGVFWNKDSFSVGHPFGYACFL